MKRKERKERIEKTLNKWTWNEKVKKAKKDFAIAFTKWVNSPEYKKLIEEMKRFGAIR